MNFAAHISTSDDGAIVVLEWWNDPRKLTVYLSPRGASYVRSWGADMDTEMEDGDLRSPKDWTDAWRWLGGSASIQVAKL